MTESILSETDIKSAMSMPLSPRSRMATASASTKPQESKKMAVGEEGFYERAVTFSGYFKESVPESPIEVRACDSPAPMCQLRLNLHSVFVC